MRICSNSHFSTLTCIAIVATGCASAMPPPARLDHLEAHVSSLPSTVEVRNAAKALLDISEILDPGQARANVTAAEHALNREHSVVNRLRLGIAYHEAALNFLPSGVSGDAQKSYDILSAADLHAEVAPALEPYIFAYLASAQALLAADGGAIANVAAAFDIFDRVVARYGHVANITLFLRGSVAENLPWFFFKANDAKRDLETIIARAEHDADYASSKTLSFVHFGLGRLLAGDSVAAALQHLRYAMVLDTDGSGAGSLASPLIAKLSPDAVE